MNIQFTKQFTKQPNFADKNHYRALFTGYSKKIKAGGRVNGFYQGVK